MPNHTIIDYRALTTPVDRAQVAAFRNGAKASGAQWAQTSTSSVIGAVASVIVGVMVIGVFAPVFGAVFFGNILASAFGLDSGAAGAVGHAIAVVVPLAVAGVVVVLALAGRRRLWERRWRLDQFARANGFMAEPLSPAPNYPGAIFSVGSSRASYDRIQSTAGRFLDLGSYRYTTGSGKNRSTHSWGFLAIQLDRRLPQIVLDARSNNGLFGGTNLPAHFARNQVLSLEGAFDRYFTLYCPREYETDALYIFTPDLMALLIDNANTFDIELVDDWLFAYSAVPFDMMNPAVLERMFRIIDTVGAKTLSQSQSYRDERMLPAGASGALSDPAFGPDPTNNLVAPRGRRLAKSVNWVTILIGAALVAGWLYLSFIPH
jgi:hypothetical protein